MTPKWFNLLSFLLLSPVFIHAGGADKGLGIPQPETRPELARIASPPTLIAPEPLAKVRSREVELLWSSVSDAQSYHVQVASDPNFKWILAENHDVKETRYLVKGLPEGTVFWRVFSQRPGNVSGLWKSRASVSSFEVIP